MENDNKVPRTDWVELEYIEETYEICPGVIFEKGTRAGLPREVWESEKETLQLLWKEIS